MSRLALLKARLAARTDRTGKPLPGYTKNVEALKAEVARLEKLSTDTTESDGENP